MDKRRVMGKRISRLDGIAKSTGAAKYNSDLKPDGMLFGALLTSDGNGKLFYGLGGWWGPPFGGLLESAVLAPADMIVAVDYDITATDGFLADSWNPRYYPLALYQRGLGGAAGRHAHGVNGLFSDGHVEYGKTNRWTVQNSKQRWNHDHQSW